MVVTLPVVGVLVLLSPWPLPWFGMTLAASVGALFFSTVLFGAYVAWRTRDRYACYFVAGWTPMMVGGLLRLAQAAGVIETDDSVAYLYALGIMLQSLVLIKAYTPEKFARLMRTGEAAAGAPSETGFTGRTVADRYAHALADAEVPALKT